MSDEDLVELVRVRLGRGFDATKLPLALEAELDVAPDRTRAALVRVTAELEEADRLRLRKQLAVGAAGASLLGGLWYASSSGSWTAGVVLVVAAIGMGAFLVSWVLSELLTGK